MKNLVLINENDNFKVERFKLGNKVFEFVHDTETGHNYFKQKDLSDMFGIHYVTVGEHLNKYLKSLESNEGNTFFARIKLKTNNGTKRVSFYGFDAVTYLAFRVNTLEAIKVRETISDILDTMFNVATGKSDMNTKMDKLEKMYEVEQFKADNSLKAYELVKSFNEELADKLMNEHIVAKNNANNCWELITVQRDWDKCYENVVNRKKLFKLVQVSNGRRKPSYRIYKDGEYVKGSIYYNKLVDWFNNEYPNAILLDRRG